MTTEDGRRRGRRMNAKIIHNNNIMHRLYAF